VHASGQLSARETLLRAVDLLAAGEGSVVRLVGPRGAGGTTVLQDALRAARARGADTVVADPGHPLSLYDIARRDVGPRGRQRALVIAVDDVTGLDAVTRTALLRAPTVLGASPVLWLSWDPDALLPPDDRAITVALRAWTPDDVLGLAQLAGATPDIARLVTEQGVPLPRHVVESIRHRPRTTGPPVLFPAGTVALLDDEDVAVVGAASMLGLRFLPDVLADVLEIPVIELVDVLMRAVRIGVLVDAGTHLEFRHALLHAAVRDRASSTSLAGYGARALRALAARGRTEDLVDAVRRWPAQLPLPEDGLLVVADVVRRRDAGLAARILRGLGDSSEPHRALHLRARIASYALQSGDAAAAADARLLLEEQLDPDTAFALGEVLCASDTHAVLAAAVRTLSSTRMSALQRLRLHALEAVCRAYCGEFDDAFIGRVAADAEAAGDLRSRAMLGLVRGLQISSRGDLLAAMRAAAIASETSDLDALAPTWWAAAIFRAKLMSDLGRLDEADAVLDAMSHEAERCGQLAGIGNLIMVRAIGDLERGRLPRAEAALHAALDIAALVGYHGNVATNALSLRVRIAHLQGDTERLPELRAALEERMRIDPPRAQTAAVAILLSADAHGHSAEVAEWAARVDRRPHPTYWIARGLTDEIVKAHVLRRHGCDDEADRVALLIEIVGGATASELPEAARMHVRALRSGDVRRLRIARDAYENLHRPVLAAYASEELATASPTADERLAVLREARALWAACGAHREVARVERLLRDAGARPRSDTPSSGAQLSPAEDRVLRALLRGGTNREIAEALFLSPHTVAVHLRRIYAKTGTGSRAELREVGEDWLAQAAP
jgi:DNA-binding CsgD family transcriptional regulator